MGEFAQLIKGAAGEPPRPLDMAAVRARAARLGVRRRAGLWLLATLAALGIGVPTGVSLVPSGDRPADVRTVDDDRDPARPDPDGVAGGQRVVGSPGSAPAAVPEGGVGEQSPPSGGERPSDAVRALRLAGRLAYVADDEVTADARIRIIDLATGSDTPLFGGAVTASERDPAFSPDGSRIAYGGADGLHVVDADGRGDRAILDRGYAPTWSPDGRSLAFVVSEGGTGLGNQADLASPPTYSIWVVDADGTGARRVDEIASNDGPSSPAWSPDGTRLAFSAGSSASSDAVYVLELGSGHIERIAAGTRPAWSPDGTRMVVSTGGGVQVVDVAAREVERTITSPMHITGLDWSPDGAWIVVARGDSGLQPGEPTTATADDSALLVVRPDGADLTVVAEGGTAFYGSPSWGPATSP
jgi:DNA-binding beta-propeller fold protein YncE